MGDKITKNRDKVVKVIGGGVAGLATAIRLSVLGCDVAVYDMNSLPGGKLSQIYMDGYRFDLGPSLFTMPQFMDELFALAGKDKSLYFEYFKKDIVCNYFYEDGTQFTAYADIKRFISEASSVFNENPLNIEKYLQSSKQKYDLTSSLFLNKSLHKLSTYLSKDTIKAIAKLHKLDVFKSLHQVNAKMFNNERLVQLFDRFATYNGSSPYLTPGIMSMIPHLEQYFGTYFPKGGMFSITKSLHKLAEDLGVQFYLGHKVEKILTKNKKAIGIQVSGEKLYSDIVVSNMDVVPTYKKLLTEHKAPEKIINQPRSSSALIFYWGMKGEFNKLDLHNIFFSKDYKTEFEYLFDKNQIYEDPTVYVNITSKHEKNDAPQGSENWFVMVNAPKNCGQEWDKIIAQIRKKSTE